MSLGTTFKTVFGGSRTDMFRWKVPDEIQVPAFVRIGRLRNKKIETTFCAESIVTSKFLCKLGWRPKFGLKSSSNLFIARRCDSLTLYRLNSDPLPPFHLACIASTHDFIVRVLAFEKKSDRTERWTAEIKKLGESSVSI